MLTYLHNKFHIGPHRWHAFSEEKLFDPANPSIQTAVKIRRRCDCGVVLTTLDTTPNIATLQTLAFTQTL